MAVFISELCPPLGWLLHCGSTVFNIKSELFFFSSGVILAVTIRDLKIQHRDGNENVKKITRLISKISTCITKCVISRFMENVKKCVGIIALKVERNQIYFLSDVPVAVASLDLKVLIFSLRL